MILRQILLASLVVPIPRATAEFPLKANDERVKNEVYNFDSETLCLASSVKSIILEHNGRRLLILDNGYGKWKLKDSGLYVQDLNAWTAAFDITNDFDNTDIEPIWQHKKKPKREPVTNHAGIWSDASQTCFYIHDGHFYDGENFTVSDYHLRKGEYPGYEVWKFDVAAKTADPDNKNLNPWTNVSLIGAEHANRTFSGAGVSVPKSNKSFWIGGITNPYTSNDSPKGIFEPTAQMIEFDAGTREISTDQTYFTDDPAYGYWHGSLDHLPIGCDDNEPGFLISMMSQKWPLGENGTDIDATNNETGIPVGFETVWLYNVTSGRWYEQKTGWSLGDIPQNRSRYCTAVIYDQEIQTWDLWLLGGQSLDDDKNKGFDEVWILTMPSFEWVRLESGAGQVNRLRGHSCHAVGSQLLVIGGISPHKSPDMEAECTPPFIKLLDMNADAPGLDTRFKADGVYKSSGYIRWGAGNRPSPQQGWGHPDIKAAFDRGRECRPPKPTRNDIVAVAAGVSVGGVILGMVIVLLWCWRDSRRPKPKHPKISSLVFKSVYQEEPRQYLTYDQIQEKYSGKTDVLSVQSPTSPANSAAINPSVAGTEPSQFLTAGPGSTEEAISTTGGGSTVTESARISNIEEERSYETGAAREVVSPSETVASPVPPAPPSPTRSPVLDETISRPVPSYSTQEDYARGGL